MEGVIPCLRKKAGISCCRLALSGGVSLVEGLNVEGYLIPIAFQGKGGEGISTVLEGGGFAIVFVEVEVVVRAGEDMNF